MEFAVLIRVCVSFEASVAASLILTGIGGAALMIAEPRDRPLAMTPIIFGLHQAVEAVVWWTSGANALPAVNRSAAFGFMAIALFVWPIWVPCVVLRSEPDERRKSVLRILVPVGILAALVFTSMLFAGGVTAHVSSGHIEYRLPAASDDIVLWRSLYGSLILVPLFFSTRRNLRHLGIAVAAGLIVSATRYSAWFPSLWCFIAGWTSLSVALALLVEHRMNVVPEMSMP